MVDSSSILPLLYSTLTGSSQTGTSQSTSALGMQSFNNLLQQYMLNSTSGDTSSGLNSSSLMSSLFSNQSSSSSDSMSSLMQAMGLLPSQSSSLLGSSSTSDLFSNNDLFSSGYDSSMLSQLASSGAVSASDISQLSNLSMLSSLSSLGSSDDSEDSNSFFSTSNFMAPVISSLVEKLVERQQNALAVATSGVHINQFKAELEAGGDGVNQNCGPASLAMALHSLGVKVKGETSSSTQQEVISLARTSMVNDTAKLDENTATNLEDIIRGVKAAGANASKLTANAENIQAALQVGGKVVVSGTFEGKQPLPWTGDSSTDSKTAPGGAAEHIVTVTGYNALTGKFTVDDPARNTSLSVNAKTLEYFMKDNAGAVAVFS